MTAFRRFFAIVALALFAIAAAPASHAQLSPSAPVGNTSGAIAGTNDPKKVAEDLLRWSIPSGDFIAQSIFAVVPVADIFSDSKKASGAADFPSTTAIGDIVGFINVLIVGLAILIVMVRMTEWLINVGREGKWETGEVNMWASVRFGLALFAVLPIPGGGGFNAAQYAFGTIARAGYSGGNMAWNYAMGLSTTQGRATIVPGMNPAIPEMVAHIGMIELCRAGVDGYSYDMFGTPASASVAKWVEEEFGGRYRLSIRFDDSKADAMGVAKIFLANLISTCGYINLEKGAIAVDAEPSLFYKAHRPAILEARTAAMAMANEVLTAWFRRPPGYELAMGVAIEKFMSTAPRAYAARIANESAAILSKTIAEKAASGRTTAESQLAETAKFAGWTNAGAFYTSYARVATSAAQVASIIPTVSPPVWEDFRKLYGENLFNADIGPRGLVERYRKNVASYVDPGAPDWTRAGLGGQSGNPIYASTASDTSRIGVVFPGATAFNNAFMTTIQDLMRSFMDPSYRGTNGFNPNVMQTQIEMGHRMMFIGGVLMASSFMADSAAEAASDTAGGVLRQIPVIGTAISVGAGLAKGAAKLIIVNGLTIGTALIGLGALWAYLLPVMIVFMWYAAILGWVMLIIEAILVASLMAIANMTTGETTVLSQKSGHGLNVAFNLAFRPILMTAGLIVSVLVYSVISSGASNGVFTYAVPSMLGDSNYGPIGFVLMLLALTIFNFSLLMWLGNLANTMADNVPVWLGMNAGPQYHSSQAVSQMSNLGSIAGAHQTAGTIRSGVETIVRGATSKGGGDKKGGDTDRGSGKQGRMAETGGGIE